MFQIDIKKIQVPILCILCFSVVFVDNERLE